MGRPIKAHQSNRPVNRSNRSINRSNRPVNQSNRPVYQSKPVTHSILNLDFNSNRSNRPVNRSNRPVYRYEPIELSFLNSNLNLAGFRPNRSGIPVPDPAGLAGPVGNLNPGWSSLGESKIASDFNSHLTIIYIIALLRTLGIK